MTSRRRETARTVGIALAVVLCASLAASSVAADDAGPSTADAVIPPGQEALIGAMLGRGMALHDCVLVSGGVQFSVIKATYRCLFGEVTLDLGHVETATAESLLTGQFAITLESGSPPEGFGDAVASLVRSHEDDIVWSWPGYEAAGDDGAGADTGE